MEFTLKERVIIKIFVGFLVDPPLRHALGRSARWREAKLDPATELVLIPYQGKEYLGIYLGAPLITMEKLRIVDEEVRRKVLEYCPMYDEKLLHFQIFSQVFIS